MNKNIVSSILYLIAAICLFIFAYNLTHAFLYIGILFLFIAIIYSKRVNQNEKNKLQQLDLHYFYHPNGNRIGNLIFYTYKYGIY